MRRVMQLVYEVFGSAPEVDSLSVDYFPEADYAREVLEADCALEAGYNLEQ
jgi:hypothetical protein